MMMVITMMMMMMMIIIIIIIIIIITLLSRPRYITFMMALVFDLVGHLVAWSVATHPTCFFAWISKTDVQRPLRLCCASIVAREGRKEMFYLTTHSTHFIYGYMASDI